MTPPGLCTATEPRKLFFEAGWSRIRTGWINTAVIPGEPWRHPRQGEVKAIQAQRTEHSDRVSEKISAIPDLGSPLPKTAA